MTSDRRRRGRVPDESPLDGLGARVRRGAGSLRDAARSLARRGLTATDDGLAPITPGDRYRARDALAEATAGAGARPGRLLLTVVGTVLGIASMVVTVGLGQTANDRINAAFDAVAAKHAAARPSTVTSTHGTEQAVTTLPWDAPARAERLTAVEAAASISPVDTADAPITAVPVNDPSAAERTAPQVVATSPGLLDAVGGTLSQGRFFDAGHDARGDRVVVLGADAARRLGVTRVATLPSILIGDHAYQVIGILDRTDRRATLLSAVLMPEGTARADFGLRSPAELEMLVRVGGGPVLAEQLPVALDPVHPEAIDVSAPPPPGGARGEVQADTNMVFIALGCVVLLIGGVGIANVALLSVMERAGEIGLRRALGASRRDVAGQFVVESVIVGGLGGLIGAALGVAVVAAVSAVRHWTPVLDLRIVVAAACGGAVVGLLAGLYPALRAARMEPVAALRSDL